MGRRAKLRGIASGVLLLVVVALGAVVTIRHRVAASLSIDTPGGIDDSRYIDIGGIPQWIRIRGQDRSNPAILYLHGGPGGAVLGVSYRPFLAWERAFTVVHWDQRGAGRTYAASGYDPAATTIQRLVLDGIEVAEHASAQLGKRPLILVGHSWGSHLGARMVQQRPDLFCAYVAVGLWTDFRESQSRLYAAALARAKASGDRAAVRELEDLAQRDDDDLGRWKAILRRSAADGDPAFPARPQLWLATLLSPEYPLPDVLAYARGFEASTRELGREAMQRDLSAASRVFHVPMFLFQGRRDGHVDPLLAESWFETIEAPVKQIVTFEDGGHYLQVTDEARFLRELVQRVRPLAK